MESPRNSDGHVENGQLLNSDFTKLNPSFLSLGLKVPSFYTCTASALSLSSFTWAIRRLPTCVPVSRAPSSSSFFLFIYIFKFFLFSFYFYFIFHSKSKILYFSL